MTWDGYPGAELIEPGLRDYARGVVSDNALLVSIVRPRLLRHGIALEERAVGLQSPNETLYLRLARRHGDGAHSEYNALVRRATKFCAALDQA